MIRRTDFNFELEEERIAKYPLDQRDASKLLVYKGQEVLHREFSEITNWLDKDTLLVMNNAKVIPARLYFKRQTGALIEVLLLEPVQPSSYEQVFSATGSCRWKCIIGNSKKWKIDETIGLVENEELLSAKLIDREERIVELLWAQESTFTDLLNRVGELPLPPYLNRDTEAADVQTYQTVFAKNEGSVAAPTAGLHFTESVFNNLAKKGIEKTEVTLHVGAGTFLPIKEDDVMNHDMHREHFEVTKETLDLLIAKENRVAVGTTTLRVLESMYWLGVQLGKGETSMLVNKLEPYNTESSLTYVESLSAIQAYMNKRGINKIQAATEILILPHYTPRSIKALVTNFHLPESTLLMLVASIVGHQWRDIYLEALQNEYRFLSYGDSSLLFIE